MDDLNAIEDLLVQRYFVEVAYYGGVNAAKAPSARAHLLAGVGCCGCAEPMAVAERLLDGDADPRADEGAGGLRVSPGTELPYDGFEHLVQSARLDPQLRAPQRLREVLDAVADDLAYVSRREIHRPPDARRQYSHGLAAVMAALLLRRLTGSEADLPRVPTSTGAIAREILDAELSA
jgi:hypothetical protein